MTTTASQILRALGHTVTMVNPWRPMIRDARGRPCPLYRLDRRWRQTERNADLPREQFERLRKELLKETTHGMGARPKKLWLLAGGYALFFASMLFLIRVPWFVMVSWVVILGAFIASALTYNRRIPKAGRVLIAAGLIRESRCASCAYDLSNTPRDGDGLTGCPECGAAWKVP